MAVSNAIKRHLEGITQRLQLDRMPQTAGSDRRAGWYAAGASDIARFKASKYRHTHTVNRDWRAPHIAAAVQGTVPTWTIEQMPTVEAARRVF